MSHKSTILIVDDEPIGRQLIDAILYKEGYNLEFAENGREAFEKAKAINPDLILMDVMMPEVDGFEVCQMLRADSTMINVPIILVTALDDIDSRIRGLEAGADDYISKPFDRLELLARIKIITRLNKYRRSDSTITDQNGIESKPKTLTPGLIYSVAKIINECNENFNTVFPNSFVNSIHKGKENNNIYGALKLDNNISLFYLCGSHLIPEETIISFLLSNILLKSQPEKINKNLTEALNSLNINFFSDTDSVKPFCSILEYNGSLNTINFTGLNNNAFLIKNKEINIIEGTNADLKKSEGHIKIETKQFGVDPGDKIIMYSGSLQEIELDGTKFADKLKQTIFNSINADIEELKNKLSDVINHHSEIEKITGNIVISGIIF